MRNIAGTVNAGDTVDFGAAHIMAQKRLGSKLFVRSCYMDVWPEVEKALNFEKKALILGTPGIGKSHFGFLILLRLVLRGETVVYQGREERSRILFSAQAVRVSGIQNGGFDSELDLPIFTTLSTAKPLPS